MKSLRLVLLVLLAVLLPLRGVLAAAMPCVNAHAVHGAALAGPDASTAHPHTHEHSGPAPADSCHLCAACCGGPCVASTPAPAILASLASGASSFADPRMPAVSFVSGGPERPPRPC